MKTYSEFAKLAGVSRQAIYGAVKSGLIPAQGSWIDETCPDAVAYIEARIEARIGTPEPKPKKKVVLTPKDPPKPTPERNPIIKSKAPKQPDEDSGGGFKSKAELEIKRLEQQVESLKLRNQETMGNLIPREKVDRLVFQPISVAHQRMLSDGAKAIAAYLHPYIAGGATVQECEGYIRKQLSGFIKAAKRDMKKVISDDTDR